MICYKNKNIKLSTLVNNSGIQRNILIFYFTLTFMFSMFLIIL